jgi:hypothetical protein
MTDNVVDFTDRWLQKEQKKEELQEVAERDELDDLHDICTLLANDALDAMYNEYNLDIEKIEFSPEMIFFFETFKALILKCAGHWHPFQDIAKEFFDSQGIRVVETGDGNYHFVMGDPEEPANDVDIIPEP